MFSVQKPPFQTVKDYLWTQRQMPLSYSEVEGTRDRLPTTGYDCDRYRVRLGTGPETYNMARQALEQWKMFDPAVAELYWPGPIETDRVVAILFRAPGLWALNACRIIYTLDELTVDEQGHTIDRFGFAYGTLHDHVECGEERFTVEYHQEDQSVWYEIYCFSRPQHWLAQATYWYCRWQQARFRRMSAESMRAAVNQHQRVAA